MIALTETLANSDHLITKFSIKGSECFYKSRQQKREIDVICNVKTSLIAVGEEKENVENNNSVYIDIKANNDKKTIIGTTIRPPKH